MFENHKKSHYQTLRAKRAYILRGQKSIKNAKNNKILGHFQTMCMAMEIIVSSSKRLRDILLNAALLAFSSKAHSIILIGQDE